MRQQHNEAKPKHARPSFHRDSLIRLRNKRNMNDKSRRQILADGSKQASNPAGIRGLLKQNAKLQLSQIRHTSHCTTHIFGELK